MTLFIGRMWSLKKKKKKKKENCQAISFPKPIYLFIYLFCKSVIFLFFKYQVSRREKVDVREWLPDGTFKWPTQEIQLGAGTCQYQHHIKCQIFFFFLKFATLATFTVPSGKLSLNVTLGSIKAIYILGR